MQKTAAGSLQHTLLANDVSNLWYKKSPDANVKKVGALLLKVPEYCS